MRLAVAILAAVLAFAGVAEAGTKAGPGVVGRHHRLGPAGNLAVMAGAGLDYNFQTGQLYQAGATPGVTVVRASSKYCDDQAGNWQSVGNNLLCATNKGALIEEARTNGIRNNSAQGAIPGTPGTLPTNWIEGHNSNLTPNVIGTGTEGGIDYIDIQLLGTATSGNNSFYFGGTTETAAVNAQAWADSVFLKVAGGSLANISNVVLMVSQRAAGGGGIADLVSGPITLTSAALGSQRFSFLTTTNQATIAFVMSAVQVQTSAGPVNLTLRIGWPQLELGAFQTSPIRTTAAAATRAADVVTVTTPPTFGSAYTMFAQGTPVAPVAYANNQNLIQVSNGTEAQRIVLRRNGANGSLLTGMVGGAGGINSPGPPNIWAQAVSGKVSIGLAVNDQGSVFNGGTVATSTATALATPLTTVNLGANSTTAFEQWNGYLERIALWPTTRLPNATLQSLTTP